MDPFNLDDEANSDDEQISDDSEISDEEEVFRNRLIRNADPFDSESEMSDGEEILRTGLRHGYYRVGDIVVVDYGGSLYDSDDFLLIEDMFPLKKNRARKMLWEGNLPATDDAQIVSVAAVPTDVEADIREIKHLERRLWATLPKDLLLRILVRLPWAAQSRFRCVCSKWNHVLSSRAFVENNLRTCRSSWTIRSESQSAEQMIAFSHAENKWFDVCFSALKPLTNAWDLVPKKTKAELALATSVNDPDLLADLVLSGWALADVNGEHFCYQCEELSCHWIALCNPIISESTLLLPPAPWGIEEVLFTRLLVDKESKAFKVVVLTLNEAAIFHSISFEWAIFDNHSLRNDDFRVFVWRGDLYLHNMYSHLYVLDTTSGTWGQVATVLDDLPCEFLKKFCMVSSKDQVMLVQVDLSKDEFLRIWKMLNDAPGNAKPFSTSTWEQQIIALPNVVKTLALDFCDCTSHGSEYICFNGGLTYHWIKYDFAERQWILMPWRGDREVIPDLHWFDWEPGLEGNLRSLHLSEY